MSDFLFQKSDRGEFSETLGAIGLFSHFSCMCPIFWIFLNFKSRTAKPRCHRKFLGSFLPKSDLSDFFSNSLYFISFLPLHTPTQKKNENDNIIFLAWATRGVCDAKEATPLQNPARRRSVKGCCYGSRFMTTPFFYQRSIYQSPDDMIPGWQHSLRPSAAARALCRIAMSRGAWNDACVFSCRSNIWFGNALSK